MFGWEDRIKDRIATKREDELNLIWKRRLINLWVRKLCLTRRELTTKLDDNAQPDSPGLDHVYHFRLLYLGSEARVDRVKR